MEWLLGIAVLLVIFYLYRNGKRNADPLNRKAAAEICQYLVLTDRPEISHIVSIFMNNARYRKNARHVASMVPALLAKGGMPVDRAKEMYQPLMQAANLIPD